VTPVLALTALETAYDGFAFGPLSLRVGEEVLAVLGPSGSGKSTLLSLVAGLERPGGGSVTLDGRSLVGRPIERRPVGLVFQEGTLFPHMTARENVAYATDDDARVDELAAMLEITDALDQRPAALSGGERQRVALARTLAADPDALLLDEPLTSLDPPVRRRLRDHLQELFADLAVPVVYVTHDRRAATALGDRVAVLRDGSLEQVGTPADVLGRPATRFVAEFTGSETLVGATVTARDDDGVTLRVGDFTLRAGADAPVGETVTACVRPSRLRLADPSPGADGEPSPVAAGNGESSAVTGTVRRVTNEGDAYRVVVAVDGADRSLTASVGPGEFERLSVAAGAFVRVVVPPEHVHLVGP
jgi:molybdate/tungstate transport system ATP-binding protein